MEERKASAAAHVALQQQLASTAALLRQFEGAQEDASGAGPAPPVPDVITLESEEDEADDDQGGLAAAAEAAEELAGDTRRSDGEPGDEVGAVDEPADPTVLPQKRRRNGKAARGAEAEAVPREALNPALRELFDLLTFVRAAEADEASAVEQPDARAAAAERRACAAGKLLAAALRCGSALHDADDCCSVSLLHAAACSDACAPVVALVLGHAAAAGQTALAAAVARPTGARSHRSPFSRQNPLPESGAAKDSPVLRAQMRMGKGAAPLLYASLHGAVECASLLIRAGAQLMARHATAHDMLDKPMLGLVTAVDVATSCGHLPLLRLLLRSGADPNDAWGDKNWTPLMWGAFYSQADTARLLLLAGAEPDAVDDEGLAAVDWALASNNGQVASTCGRVSSPRRPPLPPHLTLTVHSFAGPSSRIARTSG